MANTRISNLTASASNLASTDLVPVVQTAGVGPVKMTGLQLAGGLLGSTTFNGSTVTTSSPVLNLTQTWNDGAGGTVTFTGLKFNATDTASASGSLLLDLQVGGTSRLTFSKDGSINQPGGSCRFGGDKVGIQTSVNGISIFNTGSLAWSSTTLQGGTPDLFLTRAAAATLQLGAADAAAPVAQFFKVQSGTAGASATTVSISGTSLTIAGTVTGTIAIGHAVTGTGVSAGTLITAGSGTSWTVNNSQTVGPITAYFNSVGADFTIRGSQGSGPSAGGSLIFQVAPAGAAATTAQNAYATALTIASNSDATFAGMVQSRAGSYSNPGVALGNGNSGVYITGNSGFSMFSGGSGIGSLGTTSWTMFSGNDIILARDAANTLALRNGGTAASPVPQTFNVYNFYAGASDYERAGIAWTGNTLYIFNDGKAGTGQSRDMRIVSANILNLCSNGNNIRWTVDASGNFIAGTDNSFDIGASGANRPRNVYVAGTISGGGLISTNSDIRVGSASYVYWNTRTQMSAPADGVLLLQNYAATDFTSVKFGGTTSSFPALKRISSGNCLQVIAADNTASAGFIVGNQALATSATDGFLYVPTCAGTPTGTPTTQTGTAPIVVDTTNNKLYFYSGGAWRDAGP